MRSSPTPLGWCLCKILSKMLVAKAVLLDYSGGNSHTLSGERRKGCEMSPSALTFRLVQR